MKITSLFSDKPYSALAIAVCFAVMVIGWQLAMAPRTPRGLVRNLAIAAVTGGATHLFTTQFAHLFLPDPLLWRLFAGG